MKCGRIIATLLCAAMLFTLTGCKLSEYNSAVKLMENEQWQEAGETFEKLGDYKDSADMVKLCDYNIALETMENGDYEAAAGLFDALGDYRDSREMVSECDFRKGKELMSAGDPEEAMQIFSGLAGYAAADHYLMVCRLLVEPDEFIDEFVEGMEEAYEREGLTDTLEESISGYERDERVFVVDYDGSRRDTFVAFHHYLELGVSTGNGQINGISVVSDAPSADRIPQVYREFLSSATALLCLLDSEANPEKTGDMIDKEIDGLLKQITDEETYAQYTFEHAGCECSLSVLVLDDYYRYVLCVGVPELME